MSVTESETQWFIARDGKQHGPLSELEMRTFVSHNYLRADDLIWKPGFPSWQPAPSVFPAVFGSGEPAYAAPVEAPQPAAVDPASLSGPFPMMAAPQPQPAAPSPHDYQVNLYPPHADTMLPAEPLRRGKVGKQLAIVAVLLTVIGVGAFVFATQREQIAAMLSGGEQGTATEPPTVKADDFSAAQRAAATRQSEPSSPPASSPSPTETAAVPEPSAPMTAPQQSVVSTGVNATQLDARLQKIPLWALLKKEFPDWYGGHMQSAATATGQGDPNLVLARHLAEGLVSLRRKNADKALSSSTESLKRMASAFLENLRALRTISVGACYGFIAKGELSPAVLEIYKQPENATSLNTQSAAIFEAIAEGTKSPVTHERAARGDYDLLIQELGKLGWKDEDLQTFSNPKALAQRPPDRVCQMVQDWFSAHLAVPDAAVQERLLVETLRPVVSG